MNLKKLFSNSVVDLLWAVGLPLLFIAAVIALAYHFVDPAPPKHVVISAGDGEGGNGDYARMYKDIMKDDGIDLEIRPSKGTWENLHRLGDPHSGVDVGFVQDGLGDPEKAPDLSSLGSLYYEPLWIFYRGKTEITRFSQFLGKKLAIGEKGGGTHTLSLNLLEASGIDDKNTQLLNMGNQEAADALEKGSLDAAIFMATPDEPLIEKLIHSQNIRLMSLDQAEAITRQIPFLHHLILPHGTLDLKLNLPAHDVDLVSPTATLLVRDSLHPALVYLILKAATEVHGEPGIFEKKGEFPIDKDYQFPLSEAAKAYYKTGTPFWQRYLPFWLATLADRFILFVIPVLALVIPIIKLVPRFLQWRLKSRFYERYGELKHLETQIKPRSAREEYASYLKQLDSIEERVNHMKFPLDFSDYVYSLRGHIHFVRERLSRLIEHQDSGEVGPTS